jgi:hypothetical protein
LSSSAIAVLGEAWSLHRRGGEARVAASAPASFGHYRTLAVRDEVRDELPALLIPYDRANRHLDNQLLSLLAGLVARPAVAASLGLVVLLVAEVNKGIDAVVSLQHDASATAAVAPGRPAVGHEFLPTEGHYPLSTIPRLNVYLYFVNELHGGILAQKRHRIVRHLQ